MYMSLNEVRTNMWRLYSTCKSNVASIEKMPNASESVKLSALGDKRVIEVLRERFAGELYKGYQLEANAAIDMAATTMVSLNMVQSQVLTARKTVTEKVNLQFVPASESDKKALEGMVGHEILNMGLSPDEKHEYVILTITDGIAEAKKIAKNPTSGMPVGSIAWVQEPFIITGEKEGKIWGDMTTEERIEYSRAGNIKTPSQMPKYMMARRTKVASIEINHNGREAWLEVTHKEIERFKKSDAEDAAIREELGISNKDGEDDDESQNDGKANDANEDMKPDASEEEALEIPATGFDPLEEQHDSSVDETGATDAEELP